MKMNYMPIALFLLFCLRSLVSSVQNCRWWNYTDDDYRTIPGIYESNEHLPILYTPINYLMGNGRYNPRFPMRIYVPGGPP
jgi:hypothetical protein